MKDIDEKSIPNAFSKRMLEFIRFHEPMYPFFSDDEDAEKDSGHCSECFTDIGLKVEGWNFESRYTEPCPHCGSVDGKRLSKKDLKILAYRYYVLGSVHRADYGAAPFVVFNEFQKTTSTLKDIMDTCLRRYPRSL